MSPPTGMGQTAAMPAASAGVSISSRHFQKPTIRGCGLPALKTPTTTTVENPASTIQHEIDDVINQIINITQSPIGETNANTSPVTADY